MATIATTETMTEGQSSRIVDRLPAFFRKAGANLPKCAVQAVLDDGEEMERLLQEMFQVFRQRVERRAKIIILHVCVDRTRTATQVINATGREKWHINTQVLADIDMSLHGRRKVIVEFFKLDYDPAPEELDREYEDRGLRPDTTTAVAQVMTDDPAFADERPVAIQW